MAKEQRSSKWTFLFYKESAPADYLVILLFLFDTYTFHNQ